ncbi:hypothetical protein BGX31_002232, partial [Mortierella sp. GBA43]
MAHNPLTLFCLVDGEPTSQAFPVEIDSAMTIGSLKQRIKTENPGTFIHVDAKDLALWRVSIPDDNQRTAITIDTLDDKTELDRPRSRLSQLFPESPDDNTYILVQRPQGNPHTDIKKITNEFFAAGPIANFLDAFVKGERTLPITTGSIRGLPRAWRRGFGIPSETRPSLLFMDLPDSFKPASASRGLTVGSILDMIKENSRLHIPLFGVSGCGKTRAVIELLSQHWGFYFNASDDDWGSGDMTTLYNTVQSYLQETQAVSAAVDFETNNLFARKMTLLLFLSRLLVFKYCLRVPGSNETFNSARWTLLQVCPHVLFEDLFNALFLKLLTLRHHHELDLSDIVRNEYEDAKDSLIERGCLPKIKGDTRLLVINDEAQFLGDQFNGYFQSTNGSPRPILSPILHAFRGIGQHQLTFVTCGTGLSLKTLSWVQSSGSGMKNSSATFEHLEFPEWTSKESIMTYISRVRDCLHDEESKLALDEFFSHEALEMLFQKFAGRYHPAIAAVERIVECNDPGAWKKTIEDVEDRL